MNQKKKIMELVTQMMIAVLILVGLIFLFQFELYRNLLNMMGYHLQNLNPNINESIRSPDSLLPSLQGSFPSSSSRQINTPSVVIPHFQNENEKFHFSDISYPAS
jgi:hypothetical protein